MSSTPKRAPAREPAPQRQATAAAAEATHAIENEHGGPAVEAAAAETVAHGDADVHWTRPSSLDAPPARPGYTQRWIRHALAGDTDVRNWQRAQREGWRPRPAETVDPSFDALKADNGVISVQGLILCEMPARAAGERQRYYARKTAAQIQSVATDLSNSQSAAGPAIHRDHQSQAETGRRPTVAD